MSSELTREAILKGLERWRSKGPGSLIAQAIREAERVARARAFAEAILELEGLAEDVEDDGDGSDADLASKANYEDAADAIRALAAKDPPRE